MRLLAAALILVVTSIAGAQSFGTQDLRIMHPTSRATPPGASTGAVYFVVHNVGDVKDRIVGVTTPVAGAAEFHTMAMEGAMMKMRSLAALDVPTRDTLTLAPGGLHIMLLDLKRPLREGEQFPLTLTFEKAGKVEIVAEVEPIGGKPPGRSH